MPTTTCKILPFYKAWNGGFRITTGLLKVTQPVVQDLAAFHSFNFKSPQIGVSWMSSDLALTSGSWVYYNPVGLSRGCTLESQCWYPEPNEVRIPRRWFNHQLALKNIPIVFRFSWTLYKLGLKGMVFEPYFALTPRKFFLEKPYVNLTQLRHDLFRKYPYSGAWRISAMCQQTRGWGVLEVQKQVLGFQAKLPGGDDVWARY